MISKKIEAALNKQVELEALSSQLYLAMASWAEVQGLSGVAGFLFQHSDEERLHQIKLMQFVNERGGHGVVPPLKQPPTGFKSILSVFESILEHEIKVSNEINNLVEVCLKEKDYTTHNFLQWYVSEQIEEEAMARNILDKLKLIGGDKGGLYFFDRDLQSISAAKEGNESSGESKKGK
jgi:ferritin